MAAPSPQRYRRIATEEAFAIPEQFEAWRDLLRSAQAYDPDLFLARAQTDGGQLSNRLLDLDEERLQIMDEAGIAMHLLSLTSTGVQALDAERAVSLARLANDRLAAAIARHPDRYAGLATIAPQDPAGAVKEYLDWIKSDAGQCILAEKGYAPVRDVTCGEGGS